MTFPFTSADTSKCLCRAIKPVSTEAFGFPMHGAIIEHKECRTCGQTYEVLVHTSTRRERRELCDHIATRVAVEVPCGGGTVVVCTKCGLPPFTTPEIPSNIQN